MNLPALPTDNLYKFMAFAGLVTVLFGVGFPATKLGPLEARHFELLSDAKILKIEMQQLSREIAVVEKKKKPTPGEIGLLRKIANEIEIKDILLRAKQEQLIALVSELRFFWNFLRVGIFVGGFFKVLGFWLWYYRVQKPQDLLLRKQLKETT